MPLSEPSNKEKKDQKNPQVNCKGDKRAEQLVVQAWIENLTSFKTCSILVCFTRQADLKQDLIEPTKSPISTSLNLLYIISRTSRAITCLSLL